MGLDERYRTQGEVFRVSVPDTVLYGRGAAARSVSELSSEQLARVFVLTDGNLRAAGVGDELIAALQEAGEPVIHERVPGEPTASEIDGIADAARDANPTAIVAIGGGATMDSAKCVRLLLDQGGRIGDYYDRYPATDSPIALPLVTVATTAGTGSESVGAGLLVDDATREKTAISSHHMRADVAVVDPDLTLSVPPSATASTGCDALAQAIGPFIGPLRHPVTDVLAGEAIRLITANLPAAVRSGDDVEARSAVAYGSLMSGLAMANTEAMADQFFDEVLGPRYKIPHGTVAGIVLPYVLQFNRLEASHRIALMAPLVTSEPASSEAERVDQVIQRLAALADEVGLPRLADLVPAEDLPELARDTAQHPGVEMGINPGLITEHVAMKVLEGSWRREDPLRVEFS
jgi:alcohol dehydrogenase class IV